MQQKNLLLTISETQPQQEGLELSKRFCSFAKTSTEVLLSIFPVGERTPQAPSAGLVVLAAVPVCDLSWGSVRAALMALLGHNPSFLLSDFVHGFFSLCSLMSKQLHKALRGLFGYYYKNYFSSTAAFETPRRRFLSKLF